MMEGAKKIQPLKVEEHGDNDGQSEGMSCIRKESLFSFLQKSGERP